MGTNIFFGSRPIINKTPLNYTRSTNPLSITIDPNFGPLEYPELSYFYREPNSWDDEDFDDDGFDSDLDVSERMPTTPETSEDVPSELKINADTSKFHKSKDGRQLVDVKLTFEEVDGADGYQVSISGPGKKDDDD